jgi:hypothetical protein
MHTAQAQADLSPSGKVGTVVGNAAGSATT